MLLFLWYPISYGFKTILSYTFQSLFAVRYLKNWSLIKLLHYGLLGTRTFI